MTTPIPTVLVLCTGNSCRSQMAEALLRQAWPGRLRVLSAGTRPQARVAEGALEACAGPGSRPRACIPRM